MLKILIAEDDLVSRKLMWKIMEKYGDCDLVVNGIEAIDAYMMAMKEKEPYDLICLDIMMPKVDGIKVLKTIRDLEKHVNVQEKAKIIMVTALSEAEVVDDSFAKGADAYATKPLDFEKILVVMKKIGLIK